MVLYSFTLSVLSDQHNAGASYRGNAGLLFFYIVISCHINQPIIEDTYMIISLFLQFTSKNLLSDQMIGVDDVIERQFQITYTPPTLPPVSWLRQNPSLMTLDADILMIVEKHNEDGARGVRHLDFPVAFAQLNEQHNPHLAVFTETRVGGSEGSHQRLSMNFQESLFQDLTGFFGGMRLFWNTNLFTSQLMYQTDKSLLVELRLRT
ncbi:hypothetical protein COLO4_05443 [Corchorus olitorius]|uniref:Uncharacterized protein n=1 Tax=Corchorus olitorius TaxID=93759 RepID=A0A1R3KQV5_9ROSI|nr:hypothetical protein COLO4_05443 [Corchorus olitorius]